MATFEGKTIGEFDLLIDNITEFETISAEELVKENPDFFTNYQKAEAEVFRLRFIARAYRAWEANGFAMQNGDYVL